MDPQVPNQVTPEPKPIQQLNSLTVVSMAIFVLLSLGAVAFLYYQNQQLKTMLANYQVQTTPTPSASQAPNGDLANWKVFIHKSGYSIKHPDTIKVIPMNMSAPDSTPTDEYPDIMLSSNIGFDKPHLRILRLVKDFSDTKLPLMEIAQKYYQANLDMAAVPATSIQKPTQGTFLGVPSVSYIIKNKAFKSIVDEYLGYSGNYHVVWLEKDGYKYMIYWTEDVLMDQILSTFKFIEATPSASPTNY